MKSITILSLIIVLSMGCTNTGEKDSVELADSANKARIDSAITNNTTTVDEASAAFLVDAANSSMAEVDLGALGTQKASSSRVKNFASMLVSDHASAHDQIRNLAMQKNITLPDSISTEKRKEIDQLKNKSKAAFDKAFMDEMVKNHEQSVKLFEKALTDTKDPDINGFADRTLMKLRLHLDSARAVRSGLK